MTSCHIRERYCFGGSWVILGVIPLLYVFAMMLFIPSVTRENLMAGLSILINSNYVIRKKNKKGII